jgi:prepilin-type N-terminal cleavage/methylation domain-containing protein
MCGLEVVRKRNSSGFTLIELMVVIAIIAIVAAVAIPNLTGGNPRYARKSIIAQLNGITSYAAQHAAMTNHIHKISFDFEHHVVQMQEATNEHDSQGDLVYKPVKQAYIQTNMEWPEHLTIKQFIIEGFDELGRSGKKTSETWFYIVPHGMAQAVIINLLDGHDKRSNGKSQPIGLVLNPFNAQFSEYDTFQK